MGRSRERERICIIVVVVWPGQQAGLWYVTQGSMIVDVSRVAFSKSRR